MTNEQLKHAFRDALAIEFVEAAAKQEFTFSESFEQKMARLIARERHPLWRFVNTAGKKAAVILLGLLILGAASMSVKAVRDSVVEFITNVYEKFFSVTFDGDTLSQINKRYSIDCPDGFLLVNRNETEIGIETEYKNPSKNEVIIFSQSISDGTQITIDREMSQSKFITIDGNEISITEKPGMFYAFWINDGYLFELSCYGNFEEKDLIEMIQSAKPVE